jgi:hypothetical protein
VNELALVNLHKIIGTITDNVMDYTKLPEALKRRDKREPGRLRKMAYEEKIIRVLKKRWKKQKEKALYLLNLQYPGRKDVKPGVVNPDDLWDDETLNDLRIILLSAFRHGVELFEDAVLIGMDYTAVNTGAIAWAKKYTYELVKDIDATTVKALQNAISSFASTPGMTIRDVIDLLPFDDKRGSRIATTEITRAYANANVEAGKALQEEYPGVRVTKTWFTNNDARIEDGIEKGVCSICEPLHGMEVGIDEEFAPGIMEPGDPHIGCRCWIDVRTHING